MLLAIDSGNTNIVFAIFDQDGGICGEWRASTQNHSTTDEYGAWLTHLMQSSQISPRDISDIIIATVVPAGLHDLKMLSRKYFFVEPIIVDEHVPGLNVNIKIDRPEEVGVDRIVNAKAASEKYRGPIIVIDFGTATTFDIIDLDGYYCGGAIAPGINLSIEALHQAAAKLPRISINRPKKVIGTNTVDAMLSGVFWGYISMVEGMVERIKNEYGDKTMRTIATGGLAPLFGAHCKAIEKIDETLTLRGLHSIFQEIKNAKD